MTVGTYKRRESKLFSEKMLMRIFRRDLSAVDLYNTLGSLSVSVVVTDENLGKGVHILYVNHAFSEMSGYAETELFGRSPKILQGERTDIDQAHRFRLSLQRMGSASTILTNYRKSGHPYQVLIMASRLILPNRRNPVFVAFEIEHRDIGT